ncbi:hypothetical protein ACFFQW_09685 [Umezawaea endophytica]
MPRSGLVRWGSLGAAVLVLVVFLVAQRQSVDVSYGRSPTSSDPVKEGSAGELADVTVPSVEEMTAMVRADAVVRLPGSVARWDEAAVREVIGDARILVAPPGLDEAERKRVRDVEAAEIRVIGTDVTGGGLQATSTGLADWRIRFAQGDVTSLLVTLAAKLNDKPAAEDVDRFRWREPTAAELDPVVADLRAAGVHTGAGATLARVPKSAEAAFPDGALYVALPRQPFGEPVPQYGPALTALFPDRPVVVMYGDWIEYHGPRAEEFADVVGTSFYAQAADRIATYAYPQANVLHAYLNRVTDVRYAGLFDRPLPYLPLDPLRVALPALPWLFAACAVVFLVLSANSVRRGGTARAGTPARLAGLTALAIEVSALSSDPSLVRGMSKLRAAGDALAEDLPDAHVRTLLDDAAAELDTTAKALGRQDYRSDVYLRGRVA